MPKLCSIIFWVKGLPLLIFMCVVVSLIIFFSLITCFIAPSDFVRVTFDLTHPFKAVVLKLWGGPPWWDVEPLQVRWGWLREKKKMELTVELRVAEFSLLPYWLFLKMDEREQFWLKTAHSLTGQQVVSQWTMDNTLFSNSMSKIYKQT